MFRQRGPSQLQQQAAPKTAAPKSAVDMPPGGYKRLGDMLVEEGLITEDHLQQAIQIQRERGGFLGKLLVELGFTTQDQVVSCLVKQCKIPHLNLQDYEIDPSVFGLVPVDMCREHTLVPIDKLGRILTVAMVDPLNSEAIEAVRQLCPELRIKPILCSWVDYETVLNKIAGSAPPIQLPKETSPAPKAPVHKESATPPEFRQQEHAPAAASAPQKAVDPLDSSQTISHAGRTRARQAQESSVEEDEESITEDVLHDIVAAAVHDVLGGALQEVNRRLTAIEGLLGKKSAPRGASQPAPAAGGSDTFRHLAQSMRRSFGLDNEEEAMAETEEAAPAALEDARDADYDGLKIAGPLDGFRFGNFFGGGVNDFTLAACRKVAAQPGSEYNPLYIYGGVGTGKTHAACAIGTALLEQNPDLRVGYLPAAQFLDQMAQAVHYGQLETFRAYYAPWHVLIFDDIGLVGGEHAAQEELLHLVDVLVSRGCQLIFAGPVPPEQLKDVDSRLKSRLSSGLAVEIKPPDVAGRREILAHLTGKEEVKLPESVVELIAELADEDVRAMKGCLHRVTAMVKLGGDTPPGAQGLAEQVRQMLASNSA